MPRTPPRATTGTTDTHNDERRTQKPRDAQQASTRSPPAGREHIKPNTRKVLLMGDSTIKAVDKRYLLRQETVSKCRAATVVEAYKKMNTNSEQPKNKIIFCVGLNDLRQGSEVSKIEQDMRSLIEETLYRHPQAYIYVCSILPVNSPDVTRDRITQLNTKLEHLQRLWERVYYVNTMSAFLNDELPWSLFERDHVHPSKKGITLLMDTIRRKVESQQPSFRQFTSKPATPSTLSYARCVAQGPMTSSTMGHFGARDVHATEMPQGRPMQDSNQRSQRPLPFRQVSELSRLDSVDEQTRTNSATQAVHAPWKPSVFPASFPHPMYQPQMRPHFPWGRHSAYHEMMPAPMYYPREMQQMSNYYI